MATLLRQSTAVDIPLGPFVDSEDGDTPETGLTIAQSDVRLRKNGGSFAQKNDSNAASHDESGWYDIALDATDTNTLGELIVSVKVAGALPVWREFLVVPANVYDSLVAGSDNLQVDAIQAAGTAWGSGAITANSIASNAITADKIATDAVTEIQSGLATASALSIVDGVVDAIKAKTDELTFTKAGAVDANVQYVNDTEVAGDGQPGTEWGPAP